jgi:hypothetical protein
VILLSSGRLASPHRNLCPLLVEPPPSGAYLLKRAVVGDVREECEGRIRAREDRSFALRGRQNKSASEGLLSLYRMSITRSNRNVSWRLIIDRFTQAVPQSLTLITSMLSTNSMLPVFACNPCVSHHEQLAPMNCFATAS